VARKFLFFATLETCLISKSAEPNIFPLINYFSARLTTNVKFFNTTLVAADVMANFEIFCALIMHSIKVFACFAAGTL